MSLGYDPRMHRLMARAVRKRLSRRTALKGAAAGGLLIPGFGGRPLLRSAMAQAAGTLTIGMPSEPITMDPQFAEEVGDAVVKPETITIAPGHARTVIVAFKIDPIQKERTIGLCVMPYKFEGPILPRVCGRYTGRMR